MAQGQAMAGPFGAVGGIFSRRGSARHIPLTVLVCIVLLCSSFAAVTILQMRLDRSHALAQAQYFEKRRAADLAALAASGLDRLAQLGRDYADDPQPGSAAPGIRNIAVFDSGGASVAVLKGDAADIPPLPPSVFAGRKTLLPPSILAFAYRGLEVAVSFDPSVLAPSSMLTRAALTMPARGTLIQGANWNGNPAASMPVAGWPLIASTMLDRDGALDSWRGALPLYLLAILGPALAGAFLTAFFVQEFARRAKAKAAIRSLKTLRPVEAKLLVRLANAERDAVAALRAKSEFIAHMSHELRTPLNAIIGFSEVIERGLYGPAGHAKYVEYAHDIGAAGRSLHARIGDILEFANVEAGRWPLEIARVDVAAIAQGVVDEHAGRAFSRRITLDLGFGDPGEARADALAVRRILTNLVCNALTYTAEGGTVRVDVIADEGAVVALVRDSGMGFTGAECQAAGLPFQRFDRKGSVTGGGLGLAIAMELARRMGGAMRL
ncbi:MAG TPA: HAMP domain-containing sensor histidine kinase, partial [Rhizomicrobium sp.]